LSDKNSFPFINGAEELGMALFVHPWEMMERNTDGGILVAPGWWVCPLKQQGLYVQ
jgi:hypothetical protein